MSNSSLEENPNCAETHATFRLISHSLAPEIISKHLNIKPDFSSRKGEPIPGKRVAVIAKRNVWYISSEARIHSTSLERHVEFLLGRLEPKTEEIKSLVREFNCDVDLICFWMSETNHGGPILSPRLLARIASLEVEVGFDFYCSE